MAKTNDPSEVNESSPQESRRGFMRRGGKILAYSVPVIVSFQSLPLSAQAMTGGSAGGSVQPAELDLQMVEEDPLTDPLADPDLGTLPK